MYVLQYNRDYNYYKTLFCITSTVGKANLKLSTGEMGHSVHLSVILQFVAFNLAMYNNNLSNSIYRFFSLHAVFYCKAYVIFHTYIFSACALYMQCLHIALFNTHMATYTQHTQTHTRAHAHNSLTALNSQYIGTVAYVNQCITVFTSHQYQFTISIVVTDYWTLDILYCHGCW